MSSVSRLLSETNLPWHITTTLSQTCCGRCKEEFIPAKPTLKEFYDNQIYQLEDFITPALLDELGFKITSYEQNSGDHFYGKAVDKRTGGMTVLSWSTRGASCTYFGDRLEPNISLRVGKDGDTRAAFSGYVFNEQDFRKVISLTW